MNDPVQEGITEATIEDFIKAQKDAIKDTFQPTCILMHPHDFRIFDMGIWPQLGIKRLPRKEKLRRYGRLK